MKYITKLKLAAMHQWCDIEDKSTEYTIQFLQDMCKVDNDCVVAYFNLPQTELVQLRMDVNSFTELMEKFESFHRAFYSPLEEEEEDI